MFNGICTALVTPFKDNAEVDLSAFKTLIERQINAGVSAISPCGTTGESPTLSHKEHKELVGYCVEIAAKRVPVVAGTGSNSLEETIELTEYAKHVGADAALIVTPYYNKPPQRALLNHYKKIANVVNIPIILYNVPGRTGVDLSDEVVLELSEEKNIIALKDATGDLARVSSVKSRLKNVSFKIYSGDDATMVGLNAMGGSGAISVASNVAPELCNKLQSACFSNNYQEAIEVQSKLYELCKFLFVEANPIPVKYALHKMGLISNKLRAPLVEASKQTEQAIDATLKKLGLIP